jgi:prepilin-type N-terminal cleavage/methylation domain-containing protein
MKKSQVSRAGFTLVELMTVVGLLGMLLTLALPNLIRARSTSQERICITTLNKIEWAKQMWGLEHAKSIDEIPTDADLVGGGGYLKFKPVCPGSGSYDYNALKLPASCTITGHSL